MERVYTIKETADLVRLSTDEVYRLVNTGDIPGAYRGGRGGKTSPIHIPESGITKYQNSRPRVA